ncbi:MAG: hypothetical protein FJ279_04755 [Planctomycetes bacterium]|nr:hypothetical protein [Verrucomicrobiota bacterium]MBM4044403.1 hypothetical protein [Planctomycetota bacterium]
MNVSSGEETRVDRGSLPPIGGRVKAFAAAVSLVVAFPVASWLAGCMGKPLGVAELDFIVLSDVEAACDPERDSVQYFPGVAAAVREAGQGDFLVAVGDISPARELDRMIRAAMGDGYPWYFVVGNHDVKEKHLSWLKSRAETLPGVVRRGPRNSEETTYSFDHKGVHFVVINQYYSGLSDDEDWSDICPSLYDWLEQDLAGNSGKRIFVFGHEPVASIPDADNGLVTHEETNLSRHEKNAYRFWRLLRDKGVTAYVCGHTDTFSWAKFNGVWQINAGHARGPLQDDTSSTFLRFLVRDDACSVQVFRSEGDAGNFRLRQTIVLD